MSEEELQARVRAVERALTDADTGVAELSDAAAVHERLDDLEAELATLAERVDALDATVQSLHGYVGELEHVNDRVERRADAARAAVERLDGRNRQPTQRDAPEPTPVEAETPDHSSTDAGTADGSDGDTGESLVDRVRDSL